MQKKFKRKEKSSSRYNKTRHLYCSYLIKNAWNDLTSLILFLFSKIIFFSFLVNWTIHKNRVIFSFQFSVFFISPLKNILCCFRIWDRIWRKGDILHETFLKETYKFIFLMSSTNAKPLNVFLFQDVKVLKLSQKCLDFSFCETLKQFFLFFFWKTPHVFF